jgi:stage 0 sporulation regulatory protein
MPLVSLVELIEEKRRNMFEFADQYGLTDDKTVKCSQELDHLLNMYWKVINGAKIEKYCFISA